MSSEPTKCSAITASGQPCKAWAIRGSDPPLCAPHAGLAGGKKGNQNAVKHGYYRQSINSAELLSLFDDAGKVELDQEAVLLRVFIHRLINYLEDPELPYEQFRSAGSLLISAIRALTYLKKQLPPQQDTAWDAALDELAKEWGWEL